MKLEKTPRPEFAPRPAPPLSLARWDSFLLLLFSRCLLVHFNYSLPFSLSFSREACSCIRLAVLRGADFNRTAESMDREQFRAAAHSAIDDSDVFPGRCQLEMQLLTA